MVVVERASGFAAVTPPAGFSYLKSIFPEGVLADFSGATFAGAALLFGFPALTFCFSRCVSSADVPRLVFGATGTAEDFDVLGIADFGVSGAVAGLRESGAFLVEVVEEEERD